MKILITAGGTTEKIDDVRHITNTSTGALGCAIAKAFLSLSQVEKVLYICGAGALAPEVGARVEIYRISDVRDLQKTLEHIFSEVKIDGIVHCMAVSDYAVDNVSSSELLAAQLANRLPLPMAPEQLAVIVSSCLSAQNSLASSGKISSDMDDLLVVMKKTPKIIGMFKSIQPQAVLVGFKLLNGVGRDVLIDTGRRLMQKNNCNFVFANDLQEISPKCHSGYLIQSDLSYERLEGRPQISHTIAIRVVQAICGKEACL